MKIGIIGTGNVAKALGKALTKNGYRVMFGSRTIEKAAALAAEMEHFGDGGTIANAIHYGEIIFLAIKYKHIEEVIRSTHADAFNGKVVVDCTNPLVMSGKVELAIGHTTSAAEQIASMLPGVSVVKAFSTAFAEHIEQGPYFGQNDASMFYCGNDEEAKASVSKIIDTLGFDPVDVGSIDGARYLEPMAALLVRLSVEGETGRNIAFKLLQR